MISSQDPPLGDSYKDFFQMRIIPGCWGLDVFLGSMRNPPWQAGLCLWPPCPQQATEEAGGAPQPGGLPSTSRLTLTRPLLLSHNTAVASLQEVAGKDFVPYRHHWSSSL
jgi:hypothetical protein